MSTATEKKIGRPASEYEGRMAFRRHDDQEEVWRSAAATCGMQLADWIRATLDAEAKKAHHVPLLKRSAR